MMKELHDNGPIVIALNAPSDLFSYSGGVYLRGMMTATIGTSPRRVAGRRQTTQ